MKVLVFQHVNPQNKSCFLMKIADLVFKIREVAHPQFKRREKDLVYTAQVKLADALCPESIVIVRIM